MLMPMPLPWPNLGAPWHCTLWVECVKSMALPKIGQAKDFTPGLKIGQAKDFTPGLKIGPAKDFTPRPKLGQAKDLILRLA